MMRKPLEFLILLVSVAVLVATTRPQRAPSYGSGVAEFFTEKAVIANSLTGESPRLTVDGVALGMSRRGVELLLNIEPSGTSRIDKRVWGETPAWYGNVIVDYDDSDRVEHVLGSSLEFWGHQLVVQESNFLEPQAIKNTLGQPDSQGWQSSEHPGFGCWIGVKGFRYDEFGVTVLFSKRGRAGIHLGPHRGWEPADQYFKLRAGW